MTGSPFLKFCAPVVRLIDRVVIRMARLHLERRLAGYACRADTSPPAALDLFAGKAGPPVNMHFSGRYAFTCDSALTGVAPQSRLIHGMFYRCGESWRRRPVLLMLHGWNGERCNRWLFPLLARWCRTRQISLLSFELPCHGRRRAPSGPGCDLIWPEIGSIVLSTRQALADARTLIAWLRSEGVDSVGVWGISFGGWLAGLLACHDPRLSYAVLMSPIVDMEKAIAELEFCAPIRRSLGGEIPFDGLSLVRRRPLIERHRLLLVEGRQDLFAPPEQVEELWRAWGNPSIARLDHGHISILLSWRAMLRALRFIDERAGDRR